MKKWSSNAFGRLCLNFGRVHLYRLEIFGFTLTDVKVKFKVNQDSFGITSVKFELLTPLCFKFYRKKAAIGSQCK